MRNAWLSGCLLYFCAAAVATAATTAGPQPVVVPQSQQLTLYSQATGHDYLIQISVPAAAPPASGYAVLYVLDGNAYWPLLRAAHRMFSRHGPRAQPTPLLIVGVGYPGVQMFDYEARAKDYTPHVPDFEPRHPGREVGGADKFLTFVRERLQPAINARFDVDARQQAVIGHSFGGLFVLYALLTAPDTFAHYLAIGPSLWWGRGNLQYYVRQAQQRQDTSADMATGCLFVGRAGAERDSSRRSNDRDGESHRRSAPMAADTRELMQDVRSLYPRLDSKLVFFPGEHHGSVMWPAARRALAYLQHCQAGGG